MYEKFDYYDLEKYNELLEKEQKTILNNMFIVSPELLKQIEELYYDMGKLKIFPLRCKK